MPKYFSTCAQIFRLILYIFLFFDEYYIYIHFFIIKGSLVEKLPIYEQDCRVSSVKSWLSQVIAQSSHSSVKS